MTLCDLPLWAVESSTILLSRSVLGDETTMDVAENALDDDAELRMADRHANQIASMVASRTNVDGDRDAEAA